MSRDPLRVHRLIDPQHIGPAGGSFLQSRLGGGVVDGLAQQRQRLRLPQAAGALRQQAGLVIPPADAGAWGLTGTQVTVSNAPESAPPRTRRSASQGRRSRGHPPELEAVEPPLGQALVPQRRRAESRRAPPAQGVGSPPSRKLPRQVSQMPGLSKTRPQKGHLAGKMRSRRADSRLIVSLPPPAVRHTWYAKRHGYPGAGKP